MADQLAVEPRAGAAPAAPAVEPTQPAPAAGKAGLPDELLQIPPIQAVFAGSPPAFSTPIKEFAARPEAKLIEQNVDELKSAGMGLYRSLDGTLGVVFNQLFISGDELKSADQAGKLLEVAPPFDALAQQVAGAGPEHPVLNAPARPRPTGPRTTSPSSPPQSGSIVPPAPASAQRKALQSKIANIPAGGPTTGAKPGAGRLLNSILKPVL